MISIDAATNHLLRVFKKMKVYTGYCSKARKMKTPEIGSLSYVVSMVYGKNNLAKENVPCPPAIEKKEIPRRRNPAKKLTLIAFDILLSFFTFLYLF